jgi:hypothetical protein
VSRSGGGGGYGARKSRWERRGRSSVRGSVASPTRADEQEAEEDAQVTEDEATEEEEVVEEEVEEYAESRY